MRFTNTLALAAAAAGAFALTVPDASAQEVRQERKPGLYLGGAGGGTWVQDLDLKDGGSEKIDDDTGWAAVGTLGYRFTSNIRAELEGGFRRSDADSGGNNDGDLDTWDVMANALYDFDLGGRLSPYVGVGVGGVNVNVDSSAIDDSAWAFGYQGIAGVSYALTDRMDAFADYRYLATAGLDLDSGNSESDDEYRSHTVLIGLRYTFWSPEKHEPAAAPVAAAPEPEPVPPPQPAPPPAPQEYLVFFDWDSAVLTPEARDIVRNAAENARAGGVSRIVVTGHTDTSGPADYNMGLSQRRAEAVAQELVSLGVNQQEIAVNAEGETNPLVPTGDGVREPQNRRVEIVLQRAAT
jgi:OOP family OmpA-OmpF porin